MTHGGGEYQDNQIINNNNKNVRLPPQGMVVNNTKYFNLYNNKKLYEKDKCHHSQSLYIQKDPHGMRGRK